MSATSRTTAQDEHYHYILTVWPTRDAMLLGGDAFRAATGVLSGSGAVITVTNRAGIAHLYPPMLDPGLTLSEMFSTVAQAVSVILQWDRDGQNPIDINLQYAYGELSRIDETAGGLLVGSWTSRRRLVCGRVTKHTWGTSTEGLSLSIAGEQLRDDGDFFAPGAELSSVRFADVVMPKTVDRDRAPNSAGMLVPLVYAPVGSEMRTPCYVGVDEVDAVSGASSLVPWRYIYTQRRPTNTTSAEQFQMPDDERDGRMLASRTDSVFQKTPASATDLLGDPYWYPSSSFTFTIGSASVTITPASADFTAPNIFSQYLRAGYQMKATGDNDQRYVQVGSYDRPLGQFTAVYPAAATGVVAGTAVTIPLPPDHADALYWLPTLGGIAGPDGGALTNVIDVVVDWLRYARFQYPVCFGDLEAMRTRFAGFNLSTFIRKRQQGQPWGRTLQQLAFLPIRPYMPEGVLRFRWCGPVTEQDIVATIDLDTLGSAYREEPIEYVEEPVWPIIQLRTTWDPFDGGGRYLSAFAVDGSRTDFTDTRRVPTGRAQRSYMSWQDDRGVRRADQCPSLDLDVDTVETIGLSRGLLAGWLLYRWGMRRHRMTLEIDGTLRWLEPGDIIRVTQTGVTFPSQMWRVEGLRLDGRGQGQLFLEGVIS